MQRGRKKNKPHRTNIQLKIISFKQVCFKYMLIFMHLYVIVIMEHIKLQRRMKEDETYQTNMKNDNIKAGMFYVYVYIYTIDT